MLFDPGRVKRGILPNRAMGRPLTPGMTFTIAVKRAWPDAHGLAQRALTVVRGDAAIAGEVRLDAAETEWRFAPNEPWQPGDYAISVLPVLEDVSGNRIGTAFETLTPATAPPGPSRLTFRVR